MKDIYLNYAKWENSESNILLITGISGSGKTTLASTFDEDVDVTVINTDKEILSYLERNSLEKNGAEYLYKHSSNLVSELIKNADPSKLTIIEGVHLLLADFNVIEGHPLIIKDTDLTLSNQRASVRSPEYADMFAIMNSIIFNPQLQVLKQKITA